MPHEPLDPPASSVDPTDTVTSGGLPLDTAVLSEDAPPASARPAKRAGRAFLEWAVAIVAAVVLSLLIRTFAFQTYFVPSSSMMPTLNIGDLILVDKLSVDFGTVNIGDIVVFKAPPAVASECSDTVADLVKRVIGVPGDHLSSKGNTIYVDGKALDQKWSHYVALGTPIKPITLGPNQYFMMGDNHSDSCDSRYWGTVPRSDIIGKVFLKFWPLSAWHWY